MKTENHQKSYILIRDVIVLETKVSVVSNLNSEEIRYFNSIRESILVWNFMGKRNQSALTEPLNEPIGSILKQYTLFIENEKGCHEKQARFYSEKYLTEPTKLPILGKIKKDF